MNLRAKCVNRNCPAFGIEKSVMIGRLAGFGAPNDRVLCPSCGQLMRTTKSINVSKGKVFRKIGSKTYPPGRHRAGVPKERPNERTSAGVRSGADRFN